MESIKTYKSNLDTLFNPKSVAVIGATENVKKWFGFNITKNVLDSTIQKKFLVNKSGKKVFGLDTYKNIRDVSDPVDTAIIVTPSPGVPEVMEDCAEKNIKTVVIITAGFKEIGEDGEGLEKETIGIAKANGIRFVGPNCTGISNTHSNLNLTPWPLPRKGYVGFVSQSGNLGGYIINRGRREGLGFSKFTSGGNEADLNFVDYLEYLGEDPNTKVITAYVEGLKEKEGHRFIGVAKEVAKKKPIIVLKVGRTGSGSKAAKSHTGSLAGSDSVYDAAFKQAGVLRVEKIEDLLDVAAAFTSQPIPRGKNVGVLTSGGGFGVVIADACEKLRLSLPPLSPRTIEEINDILPSRWPHANPVDMVGEAVGLKIYQIIEALFRADEIDGITTAGGIGYSNSAAELEEIGRLIERMKEHKKPFLPSVVYGKEVVKVIRKKGLSTYDTPERAVEVLSYLVKYGEYLRRSL
ncbi:MAG: acetyl-CoA synthetase [Candidatus Methanolliviera hydrocarbonicum]|uniref:acetate--CoA ligase (ADP-forming) n=1 Tax=Candidatus Methanolliviera hydrocarbonicum TaxID=2491085 RepID=A0A520KWI1_9EURY|nr:MAG: acetyl-CoA synthetase [Candidatus Methanolliviera hydrocarbonicum]